ncbi:MAG: hypothetical protein HZB25_09680 [Candidatus Eisenbacteria bacterium]|nr:hypothetical protein [Candidatus Eisenbacteria bacterium]
MMSHQRTENTRSFHIGRGLLLAAAVSVALGCDLIPGEASGIGQFGVGAGPNNPSGTLASTRATGFHLEATARVTPPLSSLGAGADLAIYHFGERLPGQGSTNVAAATVHATCNLMPGPIAPYLTGGLGIYHVTAPGGAAGNSSQTRPGIHVGAGVSLNVMRVRAFVEARYHSVHTASGEVSPATTRFVPVTIGILF